MSLNTNITNLRELLDKVNALPETNSGAELPKLSNEGIADDLVEGKELIDSTGSVITGTNPYEKVATDNAIAAEANLIAQIQTALKGKSSGATSSTLILNKIDSIGELQGDGTVSETFTHTFEFDPSVNLVQLFLNGANVNQSLYSSFTFATLDNQNLVSLGDTSTANPGMQVTFNSRDNVLTVISAARPASQPEGLSNITDYITLMCFSNENADSCTIKIPAQHWSCYLKNTLITLSNNQTKKVQDITYQDDLLVWDFDNGCFASAKPLWIKKSEIATQYYHCVFENGITLDLVGSNGNCHAIFNLDDNKFEYANNCVGKTIMTQNGPTKLLSCNIIEDIVEFYNIITDYHMNCYANNILTSTKLNNIYPIENMQFIKDNRIFTSKEKFSSIVQQYYNGMRLGEQQILSIAELNKKIENWHNVKWGGYI